MFQYISRMKLGWRSTIVTAPIFIAGAAGIGLWWLLVGWRHDLKRKRNARRAAEKPQEERK